MAQRRTANLALHFQEPLTAVVRLRANRQGVSDAESFRRQMRTALEMSTGEAQRDGYGAEEIKLAAFAVVALLDESVLNSRDPLFADWPRKPLQEELFGVHVAGETFFRNAHQLLARDDSAEVADVLEVYHLCLLLGYAGRYSAGGRGELQATADTIAAKIRRIRGAYRGLAPDWSLPGDAAPAVGADPWVRKLTFAAIGCAVLMVLLFIVFKFSLSSGLTELRNIAAQGRG
jgi:type VI secretion system protein ImpK